MAISFPPLVCSLVAAIVVETEPVARSRHAVRTFSWRKLYLYRQRHARQGVAQTERRSALLAPGVFELRGEHQDRCYRLGAVALGSQLLRRGQAIEVVT